MRRVLKITVFIWLISTTAFSQSLFYINAGGGITETTNYNLEFSIGSLLPTNYSTEGLEIIKSLFGNEDIFVTAISDIDIQKIFVYPNPTNGLIQLNSVSEIKEISILDFQMREIQKFQSIPNEINLTLQPEGVYFISVLTQDRLLYLKVIKQ